MELFISDIYMGYTVLRSLEQTVHEYCRPILLESCLYWPVWVGRWMNLYSLKLVGEERNQNRHLSYWFVQCGTKGRFPSFCCKYCYVTIVICSFMFMCISVFNSTVQSIPVRAITCNRPGSAYACITFRIRCWGCCMLNCVTVNLAVWLQGEVLQTETSQNQ